MTDATLPRPGAGGISAPVARILVIGAIIGLWQMAPMVGLADARLLPPPTDVLAALHGLLGEAEFRGHVWQTLAETGVAFLIAVPLGFLFAVLIGESAFASAMLKPLVFFVFSIPKSIFLPLFIFAFGITFQQKVAFGVFSTIFIVMIIGFAAIESVRRDHLLVARSYGASRAQTIVRVYLPSMTPVLLDCVRVAMIFNFTGILLAEMYASRVGLGNVIEAWGQAFQLDRLMAGIVLVAFLAIVFNETIRKLEGRCEHWRA
jgi:ABC-type nitrate/sulfonate/bicarbonate transport system permease component